MLKYDNFIKICKMSQTTLKNYAYQRLRKTHQNVYFEDGFVYAEGTFPVLLVAHLDTVHKELPKNFKFTEPDTLSSAQGIGGDDRCGIYMVFEVIKRFNCSVLFCEDEEVGGIGAEKFIESDYSKSIYPNYIIEFDRRGENDAVFYNCDNQKFTDFITKEFYKEAYGTFSDISIIAPYVGRAAVNLSCGYYKAHTTDEYVVLSEMEASINAACDILARTTDNDKFEYIRSKDNFGSGWSDAYGWGDYNDPYDERYYVIEYIDRTGETKLFTAFAMSDEEALGKFMLDNPTRCFDDITFFETDELNY